MKNNAASIGLFDSGVGGLTVMQEMMQEMPAERFVYFGDTARVPYGEKSAETIIRYSIENATFLMQQEIKVLVVACNTASVYSLDRLRELFSLPVIGVVDPGVSALLANSPSGRVGVLGTRGTIQSGVYQREIKKKRPDAHVVALACPLFVPLVEERLVDHPATALLVKQYLEPLKKEKIDALLLACTHYPLLRTLIQKEMGPEVTIVDSAKSCARLVAELLENKSLQAKEKSHKAPAFFVSDDPEKFRLIGGDFLKGGLTDVQVVRF